MIVKEPTSLADTISLGDHPCPIPATHDRLNECHYWWHELGRNYHEPEPFRYTLGSFLQAARGVTFMLQSEKRLFEDFSWYEKWTNAAAKEPLLVWVRDRRTHVVHKSALELSSWMELHCVYPKGHPLRDPDENVDAYVMNPFLCTHYYMHDSDEFIARTGGEDHSHKIVRHWEVDDLPGQELLEATGKIYGLFSNLVDEAHHQLGASLRPASRQGKPVEDREDGRLPCMLKPDKHRVARIKRRKGRAVWVDEPPGLHR